MIEQKILKLIIKVFLWKISLTTLLIELKNFEKKFKIF